MNAISSPIWYGYLCPQTVWTPICFTPSSAMVEGDRRERMKKDAAKGTLKLQRFAEITLKHSRSGWMIAWWTGGALQDLFQRCANAGR